MSVMQGIIDVIRKSAEENNINQIRKVKLVVGQMANAIPDALEMAFTMQKPEGPFTENAELEIEFVRTRVKCNECESEFRPGEGYIFICPQCNGLDTYVIDGEQLYVDYYEGDDK